MRARPAPPSTTPQQPTRAKAGQRPAPDNADFERYELRESPHYSFGLPDVGRRGFLQTLGGGILVVIAASEARPQESGRGGNSEDRLPQQISAWLHVGEDGAVAVFTGKVEVGQNSRTSLTQAVAEELHAPVAAIHLVMGDTDLVPFDMGTFGSRTTPTMWPRLRDAAAAARERLIGLAAQKWRVDRAGLVAADGAVRNPQSGQVLTYAELAKGQKLAETIPLHPPAPPAAEWKVAGHSIAKVDARAIVTGRHQYTPDINRPGMLYGHVLRPPAFSATLISVDTKAAQAMPGVSIVRDGNFVGVAAPDALTADRVLAALRAEWKTVPQPSRAGLFDYLRGNPQNGAGWEGSTSRKTGSIEQGLSQADHKLQRSYTVAYIAHAPLEPRAAVAEWKDGKLTVWTGTQRPFGVRTELAEAFGLGEDRVRVIMPDTGSAYGGKHTGDAAIEAARLAKAAGKPVKVVWTREEEFTWAYFRPAGVIDVSSGVRGDGALMAWEFHNFNSGPSAIATPYEVAHQHIEFHPTKYPLRQGSYRGLAATANHFARETHMDEIARELHIDPLDFRLKNIKDERLKAALEAAASRFGWRGRKASPGHGFGLACGVEKGGYVGCAAEVAVDADRAVRVLRLVASFECGAIVNPDQLKNQVEGSCIMGLGGALWEAMDFENGRILNPRFSKYRVPRFRDVPAIEVVLLDRRDLTSAGAGETPIVGVAPAVGNAIFDAAGVRLRALPMTPGGRLPGTV